MLAYSKQKNDLKACEQARDLLSQSWPKPTRQALSLRGRMIYRLDQQTIDEVVTMYESGMSGDIVATKFNISRWTVFQLVRRNGGTIRYQRLTPEERIKIVKLYTDGVPQVEIAKRIHRSPGLVWHALNRTGIWTKPPHDAQASTD